MLTETLVNASKNGDSYIVSVFLFQNTTSCAMRSLLVAVAVLIGVVVDINGEQIFLAIAVRSKFVYTLIMTFQCEANRSRERFETSTHGE